MENTFVSPLYDFAFAELFGNQKKIDNTVKFLKALLDIPEDDYDRLTVVNNNLRKFFRRDKKGVVDLKLTTKSGRIIHIELQVEPKKNFRNRVTYYLTKLLSDQLSIGDKYEKLDEVISIVICNHNLLPEESSYITEYELRNKENRSFTKLLKLVILELPKLPESEDSPVWPWLRFLKCKNKEEFDMLAERFPDLNQLLVSIKHMGLIGMIRDYQFHKALYKIDEQMEKEYIRDEGIEQGRKERDQYFLDLISQGLSIEEIKKRLEQK